MKKLKNKLVLLLVVIMLVMGLGGCGNKENVTDKKESDVTVNGETVYPLEITDSYGNVVTIEKEPEKVVSCAPNLTEMMYDLEAGNKLVGRTDYCDYPEAVLDIESVGMIDNPDIEKIISLEPDVVIATTFSEEGINTLKSAGIPVVVLHEESDVEGVYNMLSSLGKIINQNKEASNRVEEMKTTISEVQDKIKDLEKPTVYYVVGYGEYGDYTAGGDTFVAGLVELAGGDNIAKDISGWNITLEELIESDPYIIIISEYMKDDFMNSPNYCELSAVKEGRVYTIDVNMLERQGYRNSEAVLALAEIFYPEAFE